jgi:hypothetical protein
VISPLLAPAVPNQSAHPQSTPKPAIGWGGWYRAAFNGSSSISVQAFADFAGQDAELARLLGLRVLSLRYRYQYGQNFLIQ